MLEVLIGMSIILGLVIWSIVSYVVINVVADSLTVKPKRF